MLEQDGWEIVRVWNDEVYRNEDGVVETILMRVMEGRERRDRGC